MRRLKTKIVKIVKIQVIRVMEKGMLLLLPAFLLTACTGKNDITFEMDAKEQNQAIEAEGQSLAAVQGGQAAEGQSQAVESGSQAAGGQNQAAAQGQSIEGQSQAAGANPAVEGLEGETAYSQINPESGIPSVEIYVHICGAVKEPGVYALAAGSRIYEGIDAAGGFREDACEDFLNLALPLQDGQRLAVPTMEEAQAAKEDGAYKEEWLSQPLQTGEDAIFGASGNVAAQNADGRVNINTATEQELGGISGIGAGKAAAIVRYREENGRFASIEDIMKVSGIKEGTFEKIKDKITVN